jgi:hypothetical protein
MRRPALVLSLLGLAMGLLWLAWTGLDGSARLTSLFSRERERLLAEFPLTLAEPGVARVQFLSDYPASHGWAVVVLGLHSMAGEAPPPELAGLTGAATMKAGPSHVFAEEWTVPLEPGWAMVRHEGAVGLAEFHGGAPGLYELELRIESPAALLARVDHRVVVMSRLCGCELLGPTIAIPVSIALLLAGLALGAPSLAAGNARPVRPSGQAGPHGSTSTGEPAASTHETG